MTQPPGFENPTHPNHIFLLKKAIYGVKQAPRAWYNELKAHILSVGFFKFEFNSSLFIMKNSFGFNVYLLVHVDDIIVTGNNNKVVQ